MNKISSTYNHIKSKLNADTIEEYRMVCGFEPSDILRLEDIFLKQTNNLDIMSNEIFLKIPAIDICPLKDRLEMIFFELSTS